MRWREGEVVVLSSGSRIRPHKRLRAAPRCSVSNLPNAIAFLPRGEELPAEPSPAPATAGSQFVLRTGSTTSSDAARLYRHLDAVVTFGGVALLGALIGFMLGERLLPPVTSGPTARPADTSSSLESPSAERVRVERASGERYPADGVPADPGLSYAVPALALPTSTSAFEPPWRDAAAMRQGNSPVSAEAFAALVRDNRRLDAEVVALEAETMSLEMALLDRELKMFLAGLSFDDAEPLPADTGAPEPAPSRDAVPAAEEVSGTVNIAEVEETGVSSELELFASELTSEPLEPSAAGGRAIASAALGAPQQRFVIADVPPGSAAESVGLQPGDILLAVNDEEVHGMDDLFVGDGGTGGGLYELTVVRDGASFPLAYTESPADLSLRLDWVDPVFSERSEY